MVRPARNRRERRRVLMPLLSHDPGERPRQFNIVIQFSEAQNKYVVAPGNAMIPAGFGTGEGGGRVRWFLMPKPGDTLTFRTAAEGGGGIVFTNAPSFLDLTYRNGNIASTPWQNALTSDDPLARYDYDVHVVLNGNQVLIDPDVENPPPNSGGG
jgi:hypothetical protein